MIEFAEWLPDQPPIASGTITATNVIPAAKGYRSMSSFVEYSNAADSTIKGIFAAKDDAGNANLFVGDGGKLYKHNSGTNNLDDISKAGSPAYDLVSDERWRFIQFGNFVIASGGVGEELQVFQLGTSSNFSNLGGSPPKADFITTVRDFIWVANLDSGTGRIPFRVQWSGFNAVDSWTAGVDQSDFQDLPDAGNITGLVGGEYCTILTERAIFRATYSGLPLVWQFDKVEAQKGCAFKHSVCNIGNLVFYLSDDGFYAFNGERSTPIGTEKVNDFFLSDFDSNYDDRLSASVDPNREIAMWSYTSTQSSSGQPDKILVYNYVLNKWSLLEIQADLLSPFFASGYTTDNLNQINTLVDNINTNVDSRLFKGGQYVFGGAFGRKIFAFTGSPLSGTIETAEATLNLGKHTLVTKVFPYYEGGNVNLQIGTRNNQSVDATFTASVAPNNDGFAPFRSQGRYHRAKFLISGAWSNALGIDYEGTPVGGR